MKKLIIVLLLIIPVLSHAQKDTNFVGGNNSKLVLITGYNPNSVLNYIGSYMTDDFSFTYGAGPKKEIPGHITMPFKPKVTTNSKSGITFRFIIDNTKGTITKCTIDGYYVDVVNFFVRYWPTTIKFEDAVKQQTAIKYLITDKIILTVSPETKKAVIEVVSNK